MKISAFVRRCCLSYVFVTLSLTSYAQGHLRFKEEVDAIVSSDSSINNKDVILFTGSSSIRLWTDLKSTFPNYNVLNRGFGGSDMSDLVFYFDKLIRPYKSKQIFIYEGDNDLNSGKSSDKILASADSLLKLIRKDVSGSVNVYFMTPKPSISRWHLKEKYISYNRELKRWASRQKHVAVIDLWTPLLDSQGNVMKDIFLEDGLHLNKKGYAIWAKEIAQYIR
ncbi:MAG: G-D-S-L family lipolytic protein [Marivirga sp.]|nr:G-D-S-L family lipolytic protein [Marivirga sp.]